MENCLNEITDAERLAGGDIIVIPSEQGKARKRIHVSVKTLARLGLSVGGTCRSSNKTMTVWKMLAEDTGKPKVMYISDVNMDYCDAKRSEMLKFVGNSMSEPPRLPKISSARFFELPYCLETADRHCMLKFVNNMAEVAVEVLKGMMPDYMFYHSGSVVEGDSDSCISEVYESSHGRLIANKDREDDEIRTWPNMRDDLPCDSEKHTGKPMSDEGISHFVTASKIFDAEYNKYRYDDKHDSIYAPRKFFVALMKRGAKFYRPSRKFLATVMSQAIVPAFGEYVEACKRVHGIAESYIELLKGNMETTMKKIEQAENIIRDLTAIGVDKDVAAQFAAIVGGKTEKTGETK